MVGRLQAIILAWWSTKDTVGRRRYSLLESRSDEASRWTIAESDFLPGNRIRRLLARREHEHESDRKDFEQSTHGFARGEFRFAGAVWCAPSAPLASQGRRRIVDKGSSSMLDSEIDRIQSFANQSQGFEARHLSTFTLLASSVNFECNSEWDRICPTVALQEL